LHYRSFWRRRSRHPARRRQPSSHLSGLRLTTRRDNVHSNRVTGPETPLTTPPHRGRGPCRPGPRQAIHRPLISSVRQPSQGRRPRVPSRPSGPPAAESSVGSGAHDEHTTVHYGHQMALIWREVPGQSLDHCAPPGTRTPNPRIKRHSMVRGMPWAPPTRGPPRAQVRCRLPRLLSALLSPGMAGHRASPCAVAVLRVRARTRLPACKARPAR
jgi:hypothetical protein